MRQSRNANCLQGWRWVSELGGERPTLGADELMQNSVISSEQMHSVQNYPKNTPHFLYLPGNNPFGVVAENLRTSSGGGGVIFVNSTRIVAQKFISMVSMALPHLSRCIFRTKKKKNLPSFPGSVVRFEVVGIQKIHQYKKNTAMPHQSIFRSFCKFRGFSCRNT